MVTSRKKALKRKLVTIFNAVSFCIRLNQTLINEILIARVFQLLYRIGKLNLSLFQTEFAGIDVNSTNSGGNFVEKE